MKNKIVLQLKISHFWHPALKGTPHPREVSSIDADTQNSSGIRIGMRDSARTVPGRDRYISDLGLMTFCSHR